ncbi:hypothetical protein J4207_06715 [Candidatus Woesearchaeota archaeon]|nr:hypothetical protein [Candidatus Woesearchaeota archaeon]
MEEVDDIKKIVLRRLIRSNIWGGKHIPLDIAKKSVPERYRNTHKGIRILEEAMKQLVNNEWINAVSKRTGKSDDAHISLNPRKVSEIKQFLGM